MPTSPETSGGAEEIGQLRIFLTPRERSQKGFRGLFSKALYQQIIHEAKQEGLMNAIAHRTHFGYSDGARSPHDKPPSSNEYLTLCVELVGTRADLETFCQKHSDLLREKVIVYEKKERWEVGLAATSNAGPTPG
jgi:PII-like signaling protein